MSTTAPPQAQRRALPQSGAEENRGSIQRISAALRSLPLFGIAYVLACKYSSGFSASTPAPLWLAQEALNNAVKHGKAKQIDVVLTKQGNRLRLTVSDTGTGFDTNHPFSGLGLISMRERLRFLGGNVAVKSQPGMGTDLNAELPLRKAA